MSLAIPLTVQIEIARLAMMGDGELLKEIGRLRRDRQSWSRVYAPGSLHEITQVDLLLAEVMDRWLKTFEPA